MAQSTSAPKRVPCPKCKGIIVLETTAAGSKQQCPQCNAVFVISAGKAPPKENTENVVAKQEDAVAKQEDAVAKQEEAVAKQEEAVAKQEDGYDLKTAAAPQVAHDDAPARRAAIKEGADRYYKYEEEEEEAVWQPKQPPPARLLRDKTFKAPFSPAFRQCYVIVLIASLIMGSITAVLVPYMDIGGKDSKNAVDQTDSNIKNLTLVRSFDGLNVGAMNTVASFVMILVGAPFAMLMAALGLAIYRDTFEGSVEFVSWPRDWLNNFFVSAVFVLVPIFLAAFPALVMNTFLPGIGWFRMPLVVLCALILFPLFFLSALESKSPVMLCSKPIWNSLKIAFPVWREFYVLTILTGVAIALFLRIPLIWLTAICGSILIPTYFMVYFRLLGKLAWYCSGGYDEYLEALE